jgi:hypothetical protein
MRKTMRTSRTRGTRGTRRRTRHAPDSSEEEEEEEDDEVDGSAPRPITAACGGTSGHCGCATRAQAPSA